jgi:protein HIRA/HIR1
MLVFEPDWIQHGNDKNSKTPIYSIHVHPNGKWLASGGQDYKIKIWNLDPFHNQDAELDESVPKLLSTLVSHNGAVLCVRWSATGLLASGSDDTKIVIWNIDSLLALI